MQILGLQPRISKVFLDHTNICFLTVSQEFSKQVSTINKIFFFINILFIFLGRGHTKTWTVPVAIFLVSAGWWENYVDRRSPIGIIKRLGKIKDNLHKTRYFVYSFISILKMLLYFSCMLLFLHFNGVAIGTLFSQFHEAFSAHPINVTQINHIGGNFGHDTVLPDIPGGLYTLFL